MASLPSSHSTTDVTAQDVFLAWEKLRVFYNVFLTVIVLVMLFAGQRSTNPGFWINVLINAGIANVCFCAGPVGEGYLHWSGVNRVAARWTLFIFGLLIAGQLAFEAMWRPAFWNWGCN